MKAFRCWVLGLALAVISPLAAYAQAPAHFVSERPALRVDYWQLRAADIEKQLSGKASLRSYRLLFVGDSITDFWHLDANPWAPGKYCGRAVWDESFGGAVPGRKALNLGVSGDRIEHVLHRILPKSKGGEGWLDRADLQPDTIFVLLGINNSFDAESPASLSIYQGDIAVIARLRALRSQAQIVVQSLLPTDDETKNRDLVLPVNAMLKAYVAKTPGLKYLDLYPAFVDADGAQRRQLFNDSLHPSREGYRVWRDQLMGYLKAG